MLVESNKDLLFLVLAICIIWLTFFLTWLLYYCIAILRDAKRLTHQVRGMVEKVDSLAHTVKDKIDHSAASFTLIAQAAKELIVWIIEQRQERQEKPPHKRKS